MYLTGFNEPDCCLIISKESERDLKVSLHVTKNDDTTTLWSGPRAGIDGTKEYFGFENVFEIDEERIAAELKKKMTENHVIYADIHENSFISQKFRDLLKGTVHQYDIPNQFIL